MLKKRIIPVQLLINGRLVKTVRFGDYRDVGDPAKSSAVYSSQLADELVFLNIDRQHRSVEPLARLIDKVSVECFMPLTVGGGICSFEDAAFLIKNGADKLMINSAIYAQPQLIGAVAERFGTQAVIVSIDALWDLRSQRYVLCSNCGRQRHEDLDLQEQVRRCVERGAGEIFVQSIDRDGTMTGYDLRLIHAVMEAATVPVIAGGGSGNYDQLREAFVETGVSALACGSIFNFSDSNPIRAKAFLSNYGLPFKQV